MPCSHARTSERSIASDEREDALLYFSSFMQTFPLPLVRCARDSHVHSVGAPLMVTGSIFGWRFSNKLTLAGVLCSRSEIHVDNAPLKVAVLSRLRSSNQGEKRYHIFNWLSSVRHRCLTITETRQKTSTDTSSSK